MGKTTRLAAFGLLLLVFTGCAINLADYAVALARAPIVRPIGFAQVVSGDGASVALAARILNTGYADATCEFKVVIDVFEHREERSPQIAGQVGGEIKVPASTIIKGTANAGTGGGTLVTETVVNAPFHAESTYTVWVLIDRDGACFSYLDWKFKSYQWSGKLGNPL